MIPLPQPSDPLPQPPPAQTARAADMSAARAALRRGDLAEALEAVPANDDPVVLQVRGILLVALGRVAEAEIAFGQALDADPKRAPTSTGLEEMMSPGTALRRALGRLKGAFALGAGALAARNNRAAARILLGRVDEAIADLDQVVVAESNWGVPWTNGALAWLEKDRPDKAQGSARRALDLGERDARTLSLLAEAEMRADRLSVATDHVRQALDQEADYPFALTVRARLLEREAKGREGERAFFQSLALTPEVLADSRYTPSGGRGDGLFGNVSAAGEGHATFDAHLRRGPSLFGRVDGRWHRQLVEGRVGARQESLAAAFSGFAGETAVIARLHRATGGRPGATSTRFGIEPRPDARFRLDQAQIALQRHVSLGPDSRLVLHAVHRRDAVHAYGDAPARTALDDAQWRMEARWERASGTAAWTAGASFSQNRRRRDGSTAVEPIEQVMGVGNTRQLTAYVLRESPLAPNVRLLVGGLVGGVRSALVLQPVADLALRIVGAESVHLRLKPRLAEAASDLFPAALMPDTPQENRIDRTDESVGEVNRTPVLFGAGGRQLDREIGFGFDASRGLRLTSTLFWRTIRGFRTQSADPRATTALQLTPVGRGTARGITQTALQSLGAGVALRLGATYQDTEAVVSTPILSGAAFPAAVPSGERRIPNFPRWQGTAALEWTPTWGSASIEGAYVGSRAHLTTTTTDTGTVTYAGRARAVTGANLHLRWRLPREGNVRVSLYNLGRVNFFPGYPGQVTGIAGYEIRF